MAGGWGVQLCTACCRVHGAPSLPGIEFKAISAVHAEANTTHHPHPLSRMSHLWHSSRTFTQRQVTLHPADISSAHILLIPPCAYCHVYALLPRPPPAPPPSRVNSGSRVFTKLCALHNVLQNRGRHPFSTGMERATRLRELRESHGGRLPPSWEAAHPQVARLVRCARLCAAVCFVWCRAGQ